MPSLHIEAKPGAVAETVLLPGDPLRAKFIADRFLGKPACFNRVRNMLGFTGLYRGRPVSVMGTGMGMPSAAIYAHELISVFGVKNLLRTGTAGSMQGAVGLRDIVLAQAASTDSSFGKQFGLGGEVAAIADFGLLKKADAAAASLGLRCHVGNVLSSDVFYHFDKDNWRKWQKMGVLCVEMEAYALYLTAAHLGAAALAVLTVSDLLETGEHLSQGEKETSFEEMARLALDVAAQLPGSGGPS